MSDLISYFILDYFYEWSLWKSDIEKNLSWYYFLCFEKWLLIPVLFLSTSLRWHRLSSFFNQIPWVFVINQVPCVSSRWGQTTDTRGMQGKEETPCSHCLSRPVAKNKEKTAQHTLIVELQRSPNKQYYMLSISTSLTISRTQTALPIWRALEIRCLEKLPVRWSSCERHSILQRCVMKNSQLSSKEFFFFQWPPMGKCNHCLLISNFVDSFGELSQAFVNETFLNVLEKIIGRKALATRSEPKKKRKVRILMQMKTQDRRTQQAEPAEYSKNCQNLQ